MDAVADFRGSLNGDPFKETVTYVPNVGSPRDIQAWVFRNPPEAEFLGDGSVPVRRFVVWVIRSSTDGIDDPDFGQDQLEVKIKKSDVAAETFRIVRNLAEDDDGAMRLEVVQ